MPRFWRTIAVRSQNITVHYWRIIAAFTRAQWQIWQPRVDRVVQASIAISTATSTFKLSVEVIPIILSMLTVMATAPLLSAFMPAFVFDQTVIFFTVLTIAAIAGYQKFRELMLRAKLDAQIKENRTQGRKCRKKIDSLKNRLLQLEKKISAQSSASPSKKSKTTAFQQTCLERRQRNTRSKQQQRGQTARKIPTY